ncbi:MAG: glycosyltransferase family 2 protein [Elusimicrobiota bacterium]
MPLVSVIIPTHGRIKYLTEALHSVRAQTFNDYELIVVSDGPSPSTARIIKNMPGENIIFIECPRPIGPASARNAGIRRSSGEFIALLDDDDVWHPQKLEKQAKFMVRTPGIFSYTDYSIMNAAGETVMASWAKKTPAVGQDARYLSAIAQSEKTIGELGLRGYFPRTSTVMLKRDSIESLGLFDEKFRRIHDDMDLWLRFRAAHGKKSMIFHGDQPLVRYRLHHDQITRQALKSSDAYLDHAALISKVNGHAYCSLRRHPCRRSWYQ